MPKVDEKCRICGSVNISLNHKGKDRLHHIPGVFRVISCSDCGCFFTLPVLKEKELKRYYPSIEYRAFSAKGTSGIFNKLGVVKKRRYLERICKINGPLLDIGCGGGRFLREMGRRGWQVEGVEPDVNAAKEMRDEGLSVFNGYLDKACFATGRFAVVTMWHVLEHINDPRRILQEVNRILKPRGILVFCVPNIASPNARLLGPLWSGFDTPRHSSVFSEMSIKELAADAGFSIIDRCCFFGGFDALNYDFRFYLEEKWSDGPLRRGCLAMLASLPMRLLLFPPLFILDRLGRGSVITYFFRNKGGSG